MQHDASEGQRVFTSEDIVDIAVQIERNAEEIYRRAWQRSEDPGLKILKKPGTWSGLKLIKTRF